MPALVQSSRRTPLASLDVEAGLPAQEGAALLQLPGPPQPQQHTHPTGSTAIDIGEQARAGPGTEGGAADPWSSFLRLFGNAGTLAVGAEAGNTSSLGDESPSSSSGKPPLTPLITLQPLQSLATKYAGVRGAANVLDRAWLVSIRYAQAAPGLRAAVLMYFLLLHAMSLLSITGRHCP